ncbi:MAG: hypothetical protein AAF840_09295, partial [Bacteroidota bacterium]
MHYLLNLLLSVAIFSSSSERDTLVLADVTPSCGDMLAEESFGPWPCAGFQVTHESGVGNFGELDFSGNVNNAGVVGNGVNATGFNDIDGFLYTIRGNNQHLLRLHSDGTIDDLGLVAGLPGNIVVGAFDNAGNYYVKTGNTPEVYLVDVATLAITTLNPTGLFFAKDWAYHPGQGQFYGVHASDLYAYNPGTNSVSITPLTGILPGENTVYGAAFYGADGYI